MAAGRLLLALVLALILLVSLSQAKKKGISKEVGAIRIPDQIWLVSIAIRLR